MPTYLLDTTVIVDYLRGKKETVELLKDLFSKGYLLACCSINIIEVYAGMRETEKEKTENFLNSLEYYESTKEIARKAGEYKREYKEKGITLSVPDVVIASLAISNNLTLITGNPEHYPMPELKIKPHKAP